MPNEDRSSSRTATQLYDKMSFSQRSGFGANPVFIVVDFQKGLTLPHMPFYGWHDEQIEYTTAILAAMREKNYPVVFTAVAYDTAEITSGCYTFLRKIPSLSQIRVGSEMAEIDDRLAPEPQEFVLVKKGQSAFIGTPLATILTGLGIDTLIVAGCATSGCVRGTVMDATALGYRIILAREAIGDFTEEIHSRNMFDMDAKNGDIVETDAVVEWLNRLPGRDSTNASVELAAGSAHLGP
jgi:maleamate amidohydrolase